MSTKLYIQLEGNEYEALLKSALINLREPKEEARYLLRQELTNRGLLQTNQPQSNTSNNSNQGAS